MPRTAKRSIAVTIDSAITMFCVWLALCLRFGEWIAISGNQWIAVLVSLAAIPLLWAFGMYHAIFRYLGLEALVGMARACAVYGILYATIFTFLNIHGVPRTVGVLQPLLLFIVLAASRTLTRRVLGSDIADATKSNVLIYGAGTSGRQLAAAIAGSSEIFVAGFIDDDSSLHGSVLNGRRIYGSRDLAKTIAQRRITDILLAMPSTTRKRRGEIIELLRPYGLKVRTIPNLMELASGKIEVSKLRPLEIEDLLGRDVAKADEVMFAPNIFGKTVLVTGGGGSIGSEICRQIVAAKPKSLLIVEVSEFALYSIDTELHRLIPENSQIEIVPLLASVRDAVRMRLIMEAWRPDTVYHAAAYKHVPLVEHNPIEGILNNVFGTITSARVAIDAGVSDFVLISTDKAVRPTNVMGATKRLAELCLQALAAEGQPTRLSMVRFGNVLGSSGSVVPLFRTQIAQGGPVTITHDDVTRYFMTIMEAAQLVIQAGTMATGGEVFILDMGEPVKIASLARKMIELSGLTVRDVDNVDGDIQIATIGLRPGEKLHEELLIGDNPQPTSHPLIMKAIENHISLDVLEKKLARLEDAMTRGDVCAVHDILRDIVPEYALNGAVVDWIHLQRSP